MSCGLKIIAGAIDGMRLVGNKINGYNKWLRSKGGKAFLRRKKENEFYEELESGDTDIPAGLIKDKQKALDKLKQRLRLSVIFLVLLSGCFKTIPAGPDNLHPFALKIDEHIYRVDGIELQTSKGPVKLEDEWYVVSADFLRTHRENQNDLEASYKTIERDRLFGLIKLGIVVAGSISIILFLLVQMMRVWRRLPITRLPD